MLNTKTINIKIDKQFIEQSVFEEDWGGIKLDEKDLKANISTYIKESTEKITQDVIRQTIIDIIRTKEVSTLLKKKVVSFIESMSSSELLYRDEFRSFLIDEAKSKQDIINKKLNSFLESDDFRDNLNNAIWNSMFSYLQNAISNDNNSPY